METVQSISDADENPPECVGAFKEPMHEPVAMQRIIQPVSHTFKGGSPTPKFHRKR